MSRARSLPPPRELEHCVKARPTSWRPASGSLSGGRPAPGSLSGGGRSNSPHIPPYKAPPPSPPYHPSYHLISSHDGIVRFRYMSGGPVLSRHSHQLPVVLSCSFKHRWFEVLTAARLEAGLPLILSSPLARDTDHVLASASRTREVCASIVTVPCGGRAVRMPVWAGLANDASL
jgi:hypothetical protein